MNNPELLDYLNSIKLDTSIKIIISNKRYNAAEYNKIVIKKVVVKTGPAYQAESFTDKQAFHKSISEDGLNKFIHDELCENFKQLDAFFEDKTILLKFSKKDKLLISEKKAKNEQVSTSHNREKNYILKNGTYVPALFDLGVITSDGKVINSQYDKFKQINRFIEIIDDSLKGYNKDTINIIDFGCGKSYLTFVLYYYLTEIKGITANIVGLDLKSDVIEKCNKTAEKYGYENLKFFCGDIKDYNSSFSPDAVITLHACDTATDYALYNAVSWGARYIFSVPCCQHEVNNTLYTDDMKIFTDFGIVKERISSLITDTIRCKLLEYKSYSVDLMEFIDIAHSPKNLLIRARLANIPKSKKDEALCAIKKLKGYFSFEHTLYNLFIKE